MTPSKFGWGKRPLGIQHLPLEGTLEPSKFAWSMKELERGDFRQLSGDKFVTVFLQLLS